jgi:DNA mismatch repair protein MutS
VWRRLSHGTPVGPGREVSASVRFRSILFDTERPDDANSGHEVADTSPREAPACFEDLHLDQVANAITAGREEYDLKPFFYTPLREVAAVRYRHDILRDLEHEAVSTCIRSFAEQMRSMRQYLDQARKLRHPYQQKRWFLDAVAIYCDAISTLAAELARLDVRSQGLLALREYLAAYAASDGFVTLTTETRQRQDELAEVRYCVHIRGNRVTVSPYDGEADYSAEVEETFAKFRQGTVKDYRVTFSNPPDMDHVEARVLELVARLYPKVFSALDQYSTRYQDTYLDATIATFDREVQFYLAYLEYVAPFKGAGLSLCYPEVSTQSKAVNARDAFDLALAAKLVPAQTPVVCNDFALTGPERILVVTGPNQGGKTTFARMFGQLHYLASLGLPVPGSEARLFLPDVIFTHFEREEDLATLRGKLEDELLRLHDILAQATSRSIIILNESFASTTLHDSRFLGTQVLRQIVVLDALGVYVTFVDELASLSETIVSMVSTVVTENPAQRTFKIIRQPADGLAYAAAIAHKYGLNYDSLRRRIAGGSSAESDMARGGAAR